MTWIKKSVIKGDSVLMGKELEEKFPVAETF